MKDFTDASRRGRPPRISLEAIVGAGAIQARETGQIDAVDVPGVARRVGCSPQAVYHYVPNRRELQELVVDALIGAVPEHEQIEEPTARVEAILVDLFELFREVRGVATWMLRPGVYRRGARQPLHAIVQAGFDLGCDPARAIRFAAYLESFLIAFTMSTNPASCATRPQTADDALARWGHLEAGDLPMLTLIAREAPNEAFFQGCSGDEYFREAVGASIQAAIAAWAPPSVGAKSPAA